MEPLTPQITVDPPSTLSDTERAATMREAGTLIRRLDRPLFKPSDRRTYDYSPQKRGRSDETVQYRIHLPLDLSRLLKKLRPLVGVYEIDNDCIVDAVFQWLQAIHTDVGARLPEIESYVSAEKSRRASEWNARQAKLAETEMHHLTVTLWAVLAEGDLEEAAREIERVWGTWAALTKTFWRRRQCRLLAASPLVRACVRVLTTVAGFTLAPELVTATRMGGEEGVGSADSH